ncbi:MAG: EpsG family protein [Sphingobacteriaceae bacterium]|nr:EpsG family protein [Sphingobacteriaceae bacterium]
MIGIVLVCFAGFRGIGVDRDIKNYWNMFDYSESLSDFPTQEVMAKLIPISLKFVGIYSFGIAILVFAILSVSLKIYAIKKYSYAPLASVLYFFSWLFLLQDFTQIRAAVAVGILLFAVQDIYHRNLFRFILKVGLACLFHYSSLLIVPLYFVSKENLNKKIYLILLGIFIGLGLQKSINMFTLIPGLTAVSIKLNTYMLFQGMTEINVININSLINVMLVIILVLNYEKIKQYSNYSVIFIKQSYFSCLSYFVLSAVPVLAFRVSELYAIANIITVSYLCVVFKKTSYFFSFIIVLSLLLLSLNLFKQNLVGSYFTRF